MATNTLTSPSVAPLLTRLFQQDQSSSAIVAAAVADLSEAEQINLMQSKTGYLDLYQRLKHAPLAVSQQTAMLLYLLVRSNQAHTMVEFGTSIGISTLHLAAALRDNGGGRLITTEFEPLKAKQARNNLTKAGLMDLVEIREGDALQTLSTDLPDSIDMVLLDGAKALYPDILDLLEQHFRPGTLIIADDADHSPAYLARVRAHDQGYLSLPFADDVELSIWVG